MPEHPKHDPLSRFSDPRPLMPPETPEQAEWQEKVRQAMRRFRETGDETMAQEIGLFPTEEEKRLAAEQDDEEDGAC